MKTVKHFVFALFLVSAISVSSLAGEQNTPGVAAPTPTPPAISAPDEQKGDTNASIVTAETSDYLFFEALAALLSVY